MEQSRRSTIEEAFSLLQREGDPQLRALQVAIYLEDALGLTIPSELLTPQHLGSREAILTTLDGLT